MIEAFLHEKRLLDAEGEIERILSHNAALSGGERLNDLQEIAFGEAIATHDDLASIYSAIGANVY